MIRLDRIVATLGGTLLERGRSVLIPGPGHSRKDRSVSLRLTEDGRLLIHCFSPKDDWRDVSRMLMEHGLLTSSSGLRGAKPPREVTQPSFEDKIARARSIWLQSLSITGSLAENYLRHRAIGPTHLPAALRFHPRATSLEDRLHRPALIAAIRNAENHIQGVHITLLSVGGERKAKLETPRRIVGRLLHGAVRLGAADPTPGRLIVAEGLETALSAAEALCLPAWAALSAGALPRMHIPDSVRTLIIAADRGAAGEGAAEMLRAALTRRPIQIDIRFAPEGFGDWNDWARRMTREN